MAVYTVTITVATVFSYLAYYFKDRSRTDINGEKKPLIWLCLFVILSLTLVSGLRFFVGYDYGNYAVLFYDANNYQMGSPALYGVEVGFILLCRLIYMFFPSPFFMFFIVALITNVLFILAMRDISDNFWISCFLYITAATYFTSFDIIRQALAMAIVFYGTRYLLNREMLKYFLFVGIACLFHISALIMIPAYLIVNRPTHSLFSLVIPIIGVLVFVLYDKVFSTIFVLFANMKYANYKNVILSANHGANILHLVVILVPLVLAIIYRKTLIKYQYSNIFINMFILNFLFYMLAIKQVYFARFGEYFSVYIMLLIPRILTVIENKKQKLFFTCFIILFYMILWYIMLLRNPTLLNYHSIFEAPRNWYVFDYFIR